MSTATPVPPPSKIFGSLGEFYKEYFEVLFSNFWMVGIAFLALAIPYFGLTQWLALMLVGDQMFSRSVLGLFAKVGVLLFISLVSYQLVSVLLASVLAGQLGTPKVNPLNALRWAALRLPSVVGHSLISSMAVLLGALFLVLPGIYVALRLFPVPYVALFEPGVAPLSCSWELTRDRTLDMVLALVGLAILLLIANVVVGLAAALIPPFTGFHTLIEGVNLFLACVPPTVFWLLLYGWYRNETTMFQTALSDV